MQPRPLGPSVELSMGPRKAVLGWGGGCEPQSLGPPVELHMGPRTAVQDGGHACGRGYWGL
eukprot:6934384-Pyramimonas_sp.AAC.1